MRYYFDSLTDQLRKNAIAILAFSQPA